MSSRDLSLAGTRPPLELPGYEAEKLLGRGAYGEVWVATDNNTGTVIMMEAARILKEVYPNPKRTIIIGLWNGEEQGLNGSRAFVADHPDIVENTQALFNQDNGTGRVANISMQGLAGVAPYMGKWMTSIPTRCVASIRKRSSYQARRIRYCVS